MELLESNLYLVLCVAAGLALLLRWLTKKDNIWAQQNIPYLNDSLLSTFLDQKPVHIIERESYIKLGRVYGRYDNKIPILTVGDPDLLKLVLIKDFHVFPDRRDVRFGVSAVDDSVALVGGPDWRRIRSQITPAFSTGKIKQMIPLIKLCCEDLKENIRGELAASEDGEVEFNKMFGGFVIDFIARCILGTKINSLKDPSNKFVFYAKNFLSSGLPLRAKIGVMFPWIARLFHIPIFNKESVEFFNQFIIELIKKGEENEGKSGSPNLLKMLMESHKNPENQNGSKELSYEELVAQCVGFFIAGYQSTSTTLSVCMHYLAVKSDIRARVLAEIEATLAKHKGQKESEFYNDLKFTENCIYESIRLMPPAARLDRKAAEDYQLGEIRVPKDCLISLPIYALHTDPAWFPEPFQYRPERFEAEAKADIPQCAFLPFGVGPRSCIGMRLAMLTLKMTLVELLQDFTLKPGSSTKESFNIVTKQGHLAPDSVKLHVQPRITPSI